MPYKDKKKKYAASREWDRRNLEKRARYRRKYRGVDNRKCSNCGVSHLDRRFKCPVCGHCPYIMPKTRIIYRAPIGSCSICFNQSKLVRDHNHKTGKNRGLLCDWCNRGLGFFRDSSDILRRAAIYVEEAPL